MNLRSRIKKYTPWPLHYLYQKLYYAPQDISAAAGFLFHSTQSPTTFSQRLRLIGAFYIISYYVDCPHTEHELIAVARYILNLGSRVRGVIVEAGAYHGGSTAKFSLVAKLANRELAVFDSFEGMPENSEAGGTSIYGREHHFPKGSHAVGLDVVRDNVAAYGDISRVKFYKGFFSDTLPHFKEPVAAVCMNVDLVQSTKDCLKYLYPLVQPGGVLFSQDAHFPWIIELLDDAEFWEHEIGIPKPTLKNLGSSKLVAIPR